MAAMLILDCSNGPELTERIERKIAVILTAADICIHIFIMRIIVVVELLRICASGW
jgi:hypothetical protein